MTNFRMLRSRNPDEQASEPGGQDATPLRPEVPTTNFSASAMLAMAGYIDGCSEACKAHPTSESISAVRKTYGKVGCFELTASLSGVSLSGSVQTI